MFEMNCRKDVDCEPAVFHHRHRTQKSSSAEPSVKWGPGTSRKTRKPLIQICYWLGSVQGTLIREKKRKKGKKNFPPPINLSNRKRMRQRPVRQTIGSAPFGIRFNNKSRRGKDMGVPLPPFCDASENGWASLQSLDGSSDWPRNDNVRRSPVTVWPGTTRREGREKR
ncbi:hypothetical protein LY78DRAFT_378644 [Colletotrichum sublineola]|nr:hypothetical protein LY78DRAFT_378644 [Colletotrichum sublineola]